MLTKIITQMLERARQTGGVQRQKLRSGLHITIFPDTEKWILVLWRDKVYPSANEWKTVLKFWPYPVAGIEPTSGISRGAHLLRGEIPTQRVMQEPLMK